MKQLFTSLIITAFVIFLFACKKEDDTFHPKFHEPCETVLDNWEITVLPFPEIQKQHDLFFINEETGFTVGNSGTILKTTDRGQHWKFLERFYDLTTNSIVKDALTKAQLLTVFFVDENTGYVGGEGENILISGKNIDAVFLKTTDGGDTWSKQYLAGVRRIKDIYFFDTNRGLAMFLINDENNYLKYKLFATQDAGTNWEAVQMPNLTISSPRIDNSASHVGVWVVENYFNSKYLRSIDQGTTWQEVPIPSPECHWVGFQTDVFGTAICNGISYRTLNGGQTWEEVNDQSVANASFQHFHSANEGFAIVPIYDFKTGSSESWQELNSFEVYQSSDGGVTWKKSVIDKECDFTGLPFVISKELIYTLGWEAVNKFELH